MTTRTLTTIYTPKPSNGFLGEGHTAVIVFGDMDLTQTDPFIVLVDDQLNLPGGSPVGGAHPHAGFEIATFILEGELKSEHKTMKAGDLDLLTTGSGIIHFEEITKNTKTRLLQLWFALPKANRWATPRQQQLSLSNIPIKKDGANEIRVYSGSSVGLTAPTQTYTPITIVDFHLEAGYEVTQQLPASYNGFIYVLNGSVEVGPEKQIVHMNQTAWLDRPATDGDSELTMKGSSDETRFVLYAGQPQHNPLVSYGPFIGDTQADIQRLYSEYRQGKMHHVKNFTNEQIIAY